SALEAMLSKPAAAREKPAYLELIEEESLLDIAAKKGNSKALEMLMKKDPLAFQSAELGLTALINAMKYQKGDIVNLLISHGVDINGHNSLALKKAAELGLGDMATILLRNYAEVNPSKAKPQTSFKRLDDEVLPPLLMAVKNNHLEMVKLLVANGAKINVVSQRFGTAFDVAKRQNNLSIMQFLRMHGAQSSKLLSVAH
ncbi:MAG: ankyrin repeat domain-containing protein, partial [Pseudomonadota bacterium]